MLHILPDKFAVRQASSYNNLHIPNYTHPFSKTPAHPAPTLPKERQILHRGLMPQSLSQTLIDLFHHANAGECLSLRRIWLEHRTYIRIFKYIYKNRTGLLNPFTEKKIHLKPWPYIDSTKSLSSYLFITKPTWFLLFSCKCLWGGSSFLTLYLNQH